MEGAWSERYRQNRGNDGDRTDPTEEALMRPDCTPGARAAASPPAPRPHTAYGRPLALA